MMAAMATPGNGVSTLLPNRSPSAMAPRAGRFALRRRREQRGGGDQASPVRFEESCDEQSADSLRGSGVLNVAGVAVSAS